MSRPPQPLPPELGVVFTWGEARRAGVGSRRLLGADVERVFGGVYRRRDRLSRQPRGLHRLGVSAWEHRVLAESVGRYLPKNHFFSGRTAAAIWELPISLKPEDSLEVATFAPRRASEDQRLAARTVRPHLARVVLRKGIRVTDPATTWAMLAPTLSFEGGVALGDAVIRRPRIPGTQRLKREPHAQLAELEAAANAARRPGSVLLRRMLPLLVTQSASAPETHLRLRLNEWGAPTPVLDHDVFDDHGLLLGCSEFAYPELRLALEYEGAHHLTEFAQWNRDIEKYQHYAQAGWESLRVTGELLYSRRDALRRQIFEAIERRSRQFGLSRAGP